MATVTFLVGTERRSVSAGGIIGRLAHAELRLDDPSVSEAHALVSLRNGCLRLLALRRWFEVDGVRSSDVVLAAGQRIRFAPGVEVVVDAIDVRGGALALVMGSTVVELQESVYSLFDGPMPRVEVGPQPGADAVVWSTGTGWSLSTEEGVVELDDGVKARVGGRDVFARALVDLQARSTKGDAATLDPPVRVVLRHDTVHLFRPDRPPVVLSGMSARIVSEVGAMGAAVPWEVPAAEIWRAGPSHIRRQNWDRNLRRLRSKLSEADIRTDLVRADGRGNVELYLLPGDELVDEM